MHRDILKQDIKYKIYRGKNEWIWLNKNFITSVLKEIKYLRGMKDFLIDKRNSNRYCILVKEPIGKTAYFFSTPIYNNITKTLVQTNFIKSKNGVLFKGSWAYRTKYHEWFISVKVAIDVYFFLILFHKCFRCSIISMY